MPQSSPQLTTHEGARPERLDLRVFLPRQDNSIQEHVPIRPCKTVLPQFLPSPPVPAAQREPDVAAPVDEVKLHAATPLQECQCVHTKISKCKHHYGHACLHGGARRWFFCHLCQIHGVGNDLIQNSRTCYRSPFGKGCSFTSAVSAMLQKNWQNGAYL